MRNQCRRTEVRTYENEKNCSYITLELYRLEPFMSRSVDLGTLFPCSCSLALIRERYSSSLGKITTARRLKPSKPAAFLR